MKLTITFLWLIGHFLADFYFQSNKMAVEKNSNSIVLWKHNLIYFVVVTLLSIITLEWKIIVAGMIIGLFHALIDRAMISLKVKDTQKSIKLFIIDQILYLIVIFLMFLFVKNNVQIDIFEEFSLPIMGVLQWILMLVIIINPISITIRTILEPYRPEVDEKEGIANAGALVGVLERLIVFLLLSVNQYAAIGLVLTAKSIARYNRISEDPVFSEYYLLGTLLSMLLVIAPFLAIF